MTQIVLVKIGCPGSKSGSIETYRKRSTLSIRPGSVQVLGPNFLLAGRCRVVAAYDGQ